MWMCFKDGSKRVWWHMLFAINIGYTEYIGWGDFVVLGVISICI